MEGSSDYLWLDTYCLLSWLWWFSKDEAFTPRLLQSLENNMISVMSVERRVGHSQL